MLLRIQFCYVSSLSLKLRKFDHPPGVWLLTMLILKVLWMPSIRTSTSWTCHLWEMDGKYDKHVYPLQCHMPSLPCNLDLISNVHMKYIFLDHQTAKKQLLFWFLGRFGRFVFILRIFAGFCGRLPDFCVRFAGVLPFALICGRLRRKLGQWPKQPEKMAVGRSRFYDIIKNIRGKHAHTHWHIKIYKTCRVTVTFSDFDQALKENAESLPTEGLHALWPKNRRQIWGIWPRLVT